MKTRASVSLQVVGCILSLALLSASPAWAAFTYDFEAVANTSGDPPLNGQDSWVSLVGGPGEAVAHLDVQAPNQTKTGGGWGTAFVDAQRAIPLQTYTNLDTAAEFRVWMLAGSAHAGWLTTYFRNSGAGTNFFDIATESGRFSINNGSNLGTAGTFVPDNWYEVKGVVNFSLADPTLSLSYRNLTLLEVAFTPDAALQNIVLTGLAPYGPTYSFNELYVRSDKTFGVVDNIFLPSAVPEPGSLALLSTGLVGLLYMRRRKYRV